MQKYPSGRRGSPAKGVGWLKPGARVQIPPSAPSPLRIYGGGIYLYLIHHFLDNLTPIIRIYVKFVTIQYINPKMVLYCYHHLHCQLYFNFSISPIVKMWFVLILRPLSSYVNSTAQVDIFWLQIGNKKKHYAVC